MLSLFSIHIDRETIEKVITFCKHWNIGVARIIFLGSEKNVKKRNHLHETLRKEESAES